MTIARSSGPIPLGGVSKATWPAGSITHTIADSAISPTGGSRSSSHAPRACSSARRAAFRWGGSTSRGDTDWVVPGSDSASAGASPNTLAEPISSASRLATKASS